MEHCIAVQKNARESYDAGECSAKAIINMD